VPAVFVGDKLASRIPMKRVHGIAALAAATLLGAGGAVGF
jgi:putative Ca2+/H+ antiporter (TMEM165/GDT1 family)